MIHSIKKNIVGIILGSILILLYIHSYQFGKYFGFIDQGFSFLNIGNAIYHNLFVWGEQRSFGENHFLFLLDIFEYFIYQIFLSLGISQQLAPLILKIGLSLSIVSALFLNLSFIAKHIYHKSISNNYIWLIAFLPIFNLGFFNEEWHNFIFPTICLADLTITLLFS